MPPSRFGNPRGSIARILTEAGEIADGRLRLTMRLLDEYTSADDATTLGDNRRLSRADFRALLQGSPQFQQQIANRWAFATPDERGRLLKQIREAFPGDLASAIGGQVPSPIPPEQQGTALGGPPQGAGPVGPQATPGAAPMPPLPPAVPGPTGPGLPPEGPPPGMPGMPGMPPTVMPMPGQPSGVGAVPLPGAAGAPPMPPAPLPPSGMPVGPSAPPQIPLTPQGGALPARIAAAARLV